MQRKMFVITKRRILTISFSATKIFFSSSDPVWYGKSFSGFRGGCYRASPRHQMSHTKSLVFAKADPILFNVVDDSLGRVWFLDFGFALENNLLTLVERDIF
jgi:hypothetical protein